LNPVGTNRTRDVDNYFDGSVMKEEAGAGLVFISPLGVRMEYMV
jgi:hypothetical protein